MRLAPKLILAIASLVAGSIVVIFFLAWPANVATLKTEIVRNCEVSALRTISQIDTFLCERYHDIQLIANDSVVASPDAKVDDITSRLIVYRDRLKGYASLSFYNLDRIRIADTGGMSIGLPAETSMFWSDLLQGKVSAGADCRMDNDLHIDVACFAAPVKNRAGETFGFVVARIPLDVLYSMITQVQGIGSVETRNVLIDLVNHEGLLLFSNHRRKDVLKMRVPGWESVVRGTRERAYAESSGDAAGLEEHFTVLVSEQGFLDFPGNDWSLILSVPRSETLAPARALRNKILLVLVVVVILSILISFAIARTLSRPILRLAEAVRHVASASTQVPTDQPDGATTVTDIAAPPGNDCLPRVDGGERHDEIGVVIRGFNNMVARIEMRDTMLQQAHERLEQRVQQRTAALSAEVAERRSAEHSLRQSETRFREIADNAAEWIWEVNAEGLYTYTSSVVERTLGYKPEELVGQKHFYDLFAPDVRDPLKKAALETFARKERLHGLVNPNVHKDGHVVVLETSAVPMLDDEGNLRGYRGADADITERKRAEEAMRQGVAKLEASRQVLLSVVEDQKRAEEAARKANSELAAALQELRKTQAQMVREERLSALGQMASGLAHDFNNVLVPIVGYSEMLISQPGILRDSDEALRLLKDINAAGHDAKQIVHRLRLIRGSEEEGDLVPVDVNAIARVSLEMTRPRWDKEMGARGNRINIVARLGADKQPLGSETELREALMNLILNSVDAMPGGGTLTLATHVKDQVVIVEVSDTGEGMTDETKDHCLEPFFTTKGLKGTGLGLSMVHGIVGRHKGTIQIDSTLGRGTTIRLLLPCAPAESMAKETGKIETDAIVAPLRILVADDEVQSRNLIERFLKKDGHSIEMARNGREAIAKANAGTFDLVITDRSMPEANGDMVALSVKARTPDTPVMLLTGFGDIMKDEKECPVGVDRILTKPVTRQELRRAIAEVVSNQ